MPEPLSVVSVFGTRPEAIKMAPVVRRLASDPRFRSTVIVTGQHRELLTQVVEHFGVVPAHDLAIMSERQSLTDITVRSLSGLEPLLAGSGADLVLVHGDTTTTLAAALAAFYQGIPVGHVEAGLRSGDISRPFPEEMNRRLVGSLATFHFAPTPTARANLAMEGIVRSVFVTGNTAIDALLLTVSSGYRFSSHEVAAAVDGGGRVVIVDVHRRECFGRPIEQIAAALAEIAAEFPDVTMLVSLHPNPESAGPLSRALIGKPGVVLHPPLRYPEWVNLLQRAYLYVGDSGGLQEEAPAVGTPVVLVREVTERPEALDAGTVVLAGHDRDAIVRICRRLLDDRDAYERMVTATNPYGDGQAARRIVDAIAYSFGLQDRPPDEFCP